MDNENKIETSEIVETTEDNNADNSTAAMAIANNQNVGLVWNDVSQMKFEFKLANNLAQGNSIPERFKGKPGDILIGMDIAMRSNQPLAMILNNMYSVYGQIGWSGQYAIMAINNCHKFSPLKFVFNKDKTACYAQATRLSDNEVLTSEVISREIAKKEQRVFSQERIAPKFYMAIRHKKNCKIHTVMSIIQIKIINKP